MSTLEAIQTIEEHEDGTTFDEIKAMQELINSGMAWKLQGSYGREAMSMITCGYCMLGKVGHYDAYGNYVPSRYEVQAGTKGSPEHCRDNYLDNYDFITINEL